MNAITIKLGTTQLTVTTEELLHAWLEKNITITQSAAHTPPAPASPITGERYIGAIMYADGTGHHIYRLPIQLGQTMTWNDAMDYAKEQGAELPDRVESALMFATREVGEFRAWPYWTRDQYAGNGDGAWCQTFNNGHQSYDHKDGSNCVVLVRRVAI
jgi:hypothetical protein